MNNKRSNLLQILTENGWQWVFCWSVNEGRIVTTSDYCKALPASDESYFRNKSSAEFRPMRPKDLE